MRSSEKRLNQLGAYTAILIYLSAIFVFLFRILGQSGVEYWIGVLELFLVLPLLYLLWASRVLHRPKLYILQISLMIAWLVMEYMLDYRWKSDFRSDLKLVIIYVTLFFAGTGGMLGVASLAGRTLGRLTIILFLIMTVLAFLQRYLTGE